MYKAFYRAGVGYSNDAGARVRSLNSRVAPLQIRIFSALGALENDVRCGSFYQLHLRRRTFNRLFTSCRHEFDKFESRIKQDESGCIFTTSVTGRK